MWILPISNEARGTVQNFDIFVSEAPVEAEIAVSVGAARQSRGVTVQEDHVLFLEGWWQKPERGLIQSLLGDVTRLPVTVHPAA